MGAEAAQQQPETDLGLMLPAIQGAGCRQSWLHISSNSSSTRRTARTWPQPTFFLFPKVKAMLAGQHLDDDGVKVAWEGVTGSIGGEDWLAAFNAWARCCDRCIEKDGNYVEK